MQVLSEWAISCHCYRFCSNLSPLQLRFSWNLDMLEYTLTFSQLEFLFIFCMTNYDY